ncbi:replicative DNA helicase [Polluticaenibacter yanchengensis]|uniref:Replicative DNA helicase n=1 Tax=Polluticaenibacter yanchengensis TaxID=3014562 RepID=A0ABT4ULY4_9BACT|nr:replicative DNA helicase [Chitinophagaceae bacterium LY-5]
MEVTTFGKDRKRKMKSGGENSMVFTKVPPQARDLEEAVLGAIMLEKGAFDTASEILKPECFYVDAHQYIFRAMLALQQKNMPIDILTVVEELRSNDLLNAVGGPYYVTKLTNTVTSSAHIETHCKILIQKFIQRELIRISSEITKESYEDSADAFGLLDDAEGKLFDLTNSYVKGNYEDIGNVLVQSVNRIEELRNKKEGISGVPSGFVDLDKITNGWQPTDLVIIAARPAVGKTAFALNLARNAAMNPVNPTPVGVFSLEMGNAQLVQRILSAQSDVHMEKISRGTLEDHEMEQLYSKGVKALSDAPIYLDDTASLNIFELRAKCRRMVSRNNVGMIIIDYLQLMSGGGEHKGNREQEISSISRALKGLAKELKIPVLALSQLSRAVESRKEGNKIPQLSDLRESGAIEQDADMVIFIYRPDYYDMDNNENGESVKGETHIKIAKHRNGSLDTVKLRAMLHVQKFYDWEQDNDSFGPGLPSNFTPIGNTGGPGGGLPQGSNDSALFIQKGSKMNEMNDFDDGFDAENLF